MPRQDLRRQHVKPVDIGPLFAIDFYVDEPRVHQLGDVGFE
jgi:hypothetical protein